MNNSSRCLTKVAPESSPPLFQHGDLVIQAHHVGWLLSGVFTVIATAVSFWLIYKHLKWYSNKRQQRYIVRLLLMVPIYAIVSLLSFILWNQATPLLIVRDAYESIVLTAFFYLLLVYLHTESEGQKEIFRKFEIEKWVFPMGWVKWKPKDGLFFLQLMKWGILQYCFLRPITSVAAVILDFMGLYCVDSLSPGWGHLYITIIQSVSVTIAMYCLVQFYVSVSTPLKPYSPLLKLFSVKAVVFLTFWQATLLSGLSLIGVVKDTKFMTADDINVGIGALAETFEMMLFAVLHLKAFPYKPYRSAPPIYSKLGALGHAFDPRETFHEIGEGAIYMWHWMHGRDGEDAVGMRARRRGDLETALGKTRKYSPKRGDSWYLPATEENKAFDPTSERPVIGLPDHWVVGALSDYKPINRDRRPDTWEEDDDWDARLESAENAPLTLHNLQRHDDSNGSPTKPKRGPLPGDQSYRPVSSLNQEYDPTSAPRVSTDFNPAQLTLEDPPPHSTLHTYKHMRGPELRRLFVAKNRAELGIRGRIGPTRAPRMNSQPQPRSRSQKRLVSDPSSLLNPTKILEKNLYPSLSTNTSRRTELSHLYVSTHQDEPSASANDEFYDFDEHHVYDPRTHTHVRGTNTKK